MGVIKGSEKMERYSIRLEPTKKAELVKKHGTLQAAIDAALNLDLEKHIELAHEYAREEVKGEFTKIDKERIKNGRDPESPLYWRIFTAFRDGYRSAKGRS